MTEPLDLDAIRTQIVYASQDFEGFDIPRFLNHVRKITNPLFAEVERQRADLTEARAKTDGGEQAALLTAVAGMHRRVATQHQQVTELVEQHMAEIARELERIGRVLPVEPVTDDGGTP